MKEDKWQWEERGKKEMEREKKIEGEEGERGEQMKELKYVRWKERKRNGKINDNSMKKGREGKGTVKVRS